MSMNEREKEEIKEKSSGKISIYRKVRPDVNVIKSRELKIKNKQKEVVYISRIGTFHYADFGILTSYIVDDYYQQKEMKYHIDKTSNPYIRKISTKLRTEEENNIAREIHESMKPLEEYEDKYLFYKEFADKCKEADIPVEPIYVDDYMTDNPTYKFTPDMFEFREKETNRLLTYKND